MSKFVKDENAFTGLEAAIVLIAFVVVAAVFSYVMLGAGFFTTGEAQRTVHTGVEQATSNLEVSGPVVVTADSSANPEKLSKISFFLQLAAGGASVDMEKVTFTVSTADDLETFTYDGTKKGGDTTNVGWEWYVDGGTQNSPNNMLDKFEMVRITIAGAHLPSIKTNDRFTVPTVSPKRYDL